MTKTVSVLKGHKVADSVSLGISPGSRQVLSMSGERALTDMIDAGMESWSAQGPWLEWITKLKRC